MEKTSDKAKYPKPEKPSLWRRISAWLAKGAEESAKQRGCAS